MQEERRPQLGRFSKIRLRLARHVSFQLLKYEEAHRQLLAGTEFVAGMLGGYSLASLIDAITLETPPDDPSKIGLLAAAPIALAFAYASASIHAAFNESFEGVENVYEFIQGVLDESPELTDKERFEWIAALFKIIVTHNNGRYKHEPLLKFYDLIDDKNTGEATLKEFIQQARKLVNDFKFIEVFEALREIITEGPFTAEERCKRITNLLKNANTGKKYSGNIERFIERMGNILLDQEQGRVTHQKCIANLNQLFTDTHLFPNSEEHRQNRRRSRCNKAVLATKLVLDYGDHTVNNAQTLVQPLNLFEGLSPLLKKLLIGGSFTVSFLGTYGEWRPCLAATWYLHDKNRLKSNGIDLPIIVSTVVGTIAGCAATFSNFSGLTDAVLGATAADKTALFKSTTPAGLAIGLVAAASAGLGYAAGQTAVNIVTVNPVDARDLESPELNSKQKAVRTVITGLSLLARAEIYRSEIFEPIDQTLDAYLSRPSKVMLYFLSLVMLYMIVAPEVRGDYRSIGICLRRYGWFGDRQPANNQPRANAPGLVRVAGNAAITVVEQAIGPDGMTL